MKDTNVLFYPTYASIHPTDSKLTVLNQSRILGKVHREIQEVVAVELQDVVRCKHHIDTAKELLTHFDKLGSVYNHTCNLINIIIIYLENHPPVSHIVILGLQLSLIEDIKPKNDVLQLTGYQRSIIRQKHKEITDTLDALDSKDML